MKPARIQPPCPLSPDHGASKSACEDKATAGGTPAIPTGGDYRFVASPIIHRSPAPFSGSVLRAECGPPRIGPASGRATVVWLLTKCCRRSAFPPCRCPTVMTTAPTPEPGEAAGRQELRDPGGVLAGASVPYHLLSGP